MNEWEFCHSVWLWKRKSVVSNALRPHGLIVRGILQARILKWVAVPFSRGSSQPRDWTQVLLQADSLPPEPPGKPKNAGVGSLSLLQGICPTQESNQWILTSWATREAPVCCLGVSNSSLMWGPFLGDHLVTYIFCHYYVLELKHNFMRDI